MVMLTDDPCKQQAANSHQTASGTKQDSSPPVDTSALWQQRGWECRHTSQVSGQDSTAKPHQLQEEDCMAWSNVHCGRSTKMTICSCSTGRPKSAHSGFERDTTG